MHLIITDDYFKMMHINCSQILIGVKVNFVVFLSSIVIEGMSTLFLFFKCILKQLNKKQKSKKGARRLFCKENKKQLPIQISTNFLDI